MAFKLMKYGEIFAVAEPGATQDASTISIGRFSLQVKEQGGTATSWTVDLEGSLDGENWTALISHSRLTSGDGKTVFLGDQEKLVFYWRANVTNLSLGTATGIKVDVLASE